jgi:hypothetical protein
MGYAIFGLTVNGEEVTCHHERTNRGNCHTARHQRLQFLVLQT